MSIFEIREQILADLQKRYLAKDGFVKPGPHGYIGSGALKPCPNCGKGELRYSRATNGHVMARCSEGCVGWME